MSGSIWKKFLATTALAALVVLGGCSSGQGDAPANLQVQLSTSPTPSDEWHQAIELLDGISWFQVELLDEQGKPLDFLKAEVPAKSETVQVEFPVQRTGAYRIRSSAFNADGALLGTTSQAVEIKPGINQASVTTLDIGSLYYADNQRLTQTQSPAGLEKFLSFNQPGISLQGYCFFGYLGGEGEPRQAYFSLVQRMAKPIASARIPLIMVGTGVNNESLKRILLGGTIGLPYLGNSISIQQPWDFRLTQDNPPGSVTPQNTTRARIVSGTFGQPGARYELLSYNQDNENGLLETTVLVEDSMGFVSEGFGANAFMPNWLYPAQRKAVMENYGGSMEKYLRATQDPMTGQGSYYYSAPFLKVLTYSVKRDGMPIAEGTGGLLWMDVVYQTFEKSTDDIIADATWSFFIMQFPKQKKALMTTVVGTPLGDYPISSLFTHDAPKNPNGVLEPAYRWNMQDIRVTPLTDKIWTSPRSKLKYHTEFKIDLDGEYPTHLHVKMAWDEQEAKVEDRFVYEGLGNVTGTLNGEPVEGTAWLEMQPIGNL